ncbi:hypothetical protein AGLY_015249, partial [Aphis glycines]
VLIYNLLGFLSLQLMTKSLRKTNIREKLIAKSKIAVIVSLSVSRTVENTVQEIESEYKITMSYADKFKFTINLIVFFIAILLLNEQLFVSDSDLLHESTVLGKNKYQFTFESIRVSCEIICSILNVSFKSNSFNGFEYNILPHSLKIISIISIDCTVSDGIKYWRLIFVLLVIFVCIQEYINVPHQQQFDHVWKLNETKVAYIFVVSGDSNCAFNINRQNSPLPRTIFSRNNLFLVHRILPGFNFSIAVAIDNFK